MFQINALYVIKRDAAYTAGVIDAEGSVLIKKTGKYYQPKIQISNTDHEFLKDIQQMVLPWQTYITGPYENGKGHKKMFYLKVSSKKENLLNFMREIEPYIMLKATQLQLVKELDEGKAEDPEFNWKMVKKLNKRGL